MKKYLLALFLVPLSLNSMEKQNEANEQGLQDGANLAISMVNQLNDDGIDFLAKNYELMKDMRENYVNNPEKYAEQILKMHTEEYEKFWSQEIENCFKYKKCDQNEIKRKIIAILTQRTKNNLTGYAKIKKEKKEV